MEIWRFALTYNGYDRHGGFDRAAEIGNRTAEQWSADGSLPHDLTIARAALFFEQRRWHHFGRLPDGESAEYISTLVARIGSISGGSVPGPSDPLP